MLASSSKQSKFLLCWILFDSAFLPPLDAALDGRQRLVFFQRLVGDGFSDLFLALVIIASAVAHYALWRLHLQNVLVLNLKQPLLSDNPVIRMRNHFVLGKNLQRLNPALRGESPLQAYWFFIGD